MGLALVGLAALCGCDSKTRPSGVLSITSLAPASGLTTQATTVTIRGHGFKPDAKVSFGNTRASVSSLADDEIIATIGAHDPGTVDVSVTNPDGQAVTITSAFAFMFAQAPSIGTLSPSIGSTEGGTLVSVNGSNFKPGLTATLDGVPVSVLFNTFNGTSFAFIAPAHSVGTADVVVRNVDGQDTTAHPFAAHYRWTPPDALDFTGNWSAFLGDGNDSPFSFSVDDDNALTGVTCFEGSHLPLPTPVKVIDGHVSVSSNGSVLFSARIVGNEQTVGTINFGPCHSSNWTGWKDHGLSGQRER